MSQDLPQEGKFVIQTIGPVKNGTSKASGKPYKIYDLQFEGDPNWYGTFWSPKEDPQVGQELSGKKSYDSEYSSFKFEIAREGGKGNWNPAGANATLTLAAANVVGNYLALDPQYKKEWESKRKEGEPAFAHYLRTVRDVAKLMKDDVVALGSIGTENQTGQSSSAAPAAGGNAPAVESWPAGQGEPTLNPAELS